MLSMCSERGSPGRTTGFLEAALVEGRWRCQWRSLEPKCALLGLVAGSVQPILVIAAVFGFRKHLLRAALFLVAAR